MSNSKVVGFGWEGFDNIVVDDGTDKAGLNTRKVATRGLYLYPGDGQGGFLSPSVISHQGTGFSLQL